MTPKKSPGENLYPEHRVDIRHHCEINQSTERVKFSVFFVSMEYLCVGQLTNACI